MIFLGLGSNLGDKKANLEKSIDLIERFGLLKHVVRSSIIETKALLIENSPPEWDINFLNMVIAGEGKLDPFEFLKKIKEIEKIIGRKDRGKWAPREIDIDILIYNEEQINTDILTVPHKLMLEREFVMTPLLEVKTIINSLEYI